MGDVLQELGNDGGAQVMDQAFGAHGGDHEERFAVPIAGSVIHAGTREPSLLEILKCFVINRWVNGSTMVSCGLSTSRVAQNPCRSRRRWDLVRYGRFGLEGGWPGYHHLCGAHELVFEFPAAPVHLHDGAAR